MRFSPTLLAGLVGSTLASSESSRHYHGGKLTRYEIGPPALLLSSADEARLRSGRAVLQTITAEDGVSRRMIMVQDIQAPPHVVLGRIMDLNKYPEMVSGVDGCVVYSDTTQNGQQVVKSTYDISALHMKFRYYVTHTFDPAQRCMVFHLDYDRRSDLDDTVGYWYVDPSSRTKCRVYYSCECKLRGWVPGPVYSMLTKEAVKKATTWVERESMKEWRAQKGFKFNSAALQDLVENMRERVSEQMRQVKLPMPAQMQVPNIKMPTLPSLPLEPKRKAAEQWFSDRRRAATRLMSTAHPALKREAAC